LITLADVTPGRSLDGQARAKGCSAASTSGSRSSWSRPRWPSPAVSSWPTGP